uniref:Vesicle-fusing ATPase n=1 Tax=Entomoneis paludosa TaxID=265537 RepID=A0A7S2YHQ5_9STRA
MAQDKADLQTEMDPKDVASTNAPPSVSDAAVSRVAQLVAQAGAESAFDGASLGIGGLDDVLAEVKRRVWTPLAAPPQLLQELGISPVRGLLLYGRPGCGKTLLARQLGQILSPLRPITVVSGPEVLDKFVGSSEKNLREIFDNPPDIYDYFRIGEPDNGAAVASAALHVVVMDEFDAIARARGGRGGAGDQGDAGVARDSVVNQLLAKMDGVEPLSVPTMVIGLTNKRSLIDPALLRAGRFEVQVEVPPPKTVEQRQSILQVHTAVMHQAGRILVSDAPPNSPAQQLRDQSRREEDEEDAPLLTYDELMQSIAEECEGFSGASLAGLTRAAASHALERAVNEFMTHSSSYSINDCVVLWSDFEEAIQDVKAGLGDSDWAEDDDEKKEDEEETDEINASDENDNKVADDAAP